jgi:hypothetical protein
VNYVAKINRAKCYSVYDDQGQPHRRSFATMAEARAVADRMTRGLVRFELVESRSMQAMRSHNVHHQLEK